MKPKLKWILLLSAAILFHHADAQELGFFALNHSGALIRPEHVDADTQGNCYILGKSSGEVLFQSSRAQDSTISWYSTTSSGRMRTFLIKYKPNGEIGFVNRFFTNYGYVLPEAIKCLKNGDVAVLLYTDRPFRVITPTDTIALEAARNTKLLRFNSEGAFLNQTDIGGKRSDKILEDSQGNLIVFQDETYHSKREILKISPAGKTIREISWKEKIDNYFLFQDQLWYPKKISGVYGFGMREGPDSTAFFALDLTSGSVKKQFSIPVFNIEKYQMVYGAHNGRLEVNYWFPKLTNSVEVGVNRFQQSEDGLVLKFNDQGDLIASNNTPAVLYFHRKMFAGKKGALYLAAPASDTLSWKGFPKVQVKPHASQYIHELFWFKLDKHLKLEWILPGGGISSICEKPSAVISGPDRLYLVSNLSDFGHFGGTYQELKWNFGFYVMQWTE